MIRFVHLCNLTDGRGLDEVYLEEIPSMIDAYINGSNELFHEDAFGEFLSIRICNERLKLIRDSIFKRVFRSPFFNDDWGEISVSEAQKIANEIRTSAFISD